MFIRFPEIYMLSILLVYSTMIADCILTKQLQTREKFMWLLVLLFVPILGGFIYFFAVFPRRIINKIKSRAAH